MEFKGVLEPDDKNSIYEAAEYCYEEETLSEKIKKLST